MQRAQEWLREPVQPARRVAGRTSAGRGADCEVAREEDAAETVLRQAPRGDLRRLRRRQREPEERRRHCTRVRGPSRPAAPACAVGRGVARRRAGEGRSGVWSGRGAHRHLRRGVAETSSTRRVATSAAAPTASLYCSRNASYSSLTCHSRPGAFSALTRPGCRGRQHPGTHDRGVDSERGTYRHRQNDGQLYHEGILLRPPEHVHHGVCDVLQADGLFTPFSALALSVGIHSPWRGAN
jgi:hypothetical protein